MAYGGRVEWVVNFVTSKLFQSGPKGDHRLLICPQRDTSYAFSLAGQHHKEASKLATNVQIKAQKRSKSYARNSIRLWPCGLLIH